ncbi:MAG: hypothetical protein AB8H80_07880 [Planctomycetota bacterium]
MFARPDGTFGADGRGFHVDFDSRGATLQVAHPMAAEALVELRLQLADWGRSHGPRSRAVRGSGAPTARRVETSRVHFEHADVTERYRLQPTGMEQSFVLHRRPRGSGDFVLGIAAHSPSLHAPARAAAHQALQFSAAGAPAVRYGEAVAFSRADAGLESARVPVATRYDGRGRIELVVPASFLDRASYPVIIDPAVGPVLSPGGSGWVDTNPDVGYDPLHDVFVCVWERRLSANDRRIRAVRYRRDGTVLGGLIFVTGSGFFRTPTVGYLGVGGFSGFYVAWAGSTGLQGRRLESTTGSLPGGVQQLTTIPLATRDLRPALSIGSNRMQLAWDRTPNGSVTPTQIVARQIQLQSLPATGVTLGNEFVVESAGSGYVQRVRMPRTYLQTSGAEVRMVWERFWTTPAPGDFDVRTALVIMTNVNSTFLQSPTAMPGSQIGDNERRPDIAQLDGGNNPAGLVVWEDTFDIRGHRFHAAGLLGAPFDIRATPDFESGPAVGAGSTEFSVGYLSEPFNSAFEVDIYAARVDTAGNVLVENSAIEVLNGPYQRALRATSVVDAAGATNEPNGVMFGWLLESDSIGLIEDIRARIYDPVAGAAFPFGQGCVGPGGTLPEIVAAGSPYPGNNSFQIEIANAPANSLAVLVIGDQLNTLPIPGAPGCTLYMDLPILVALPTVTSPGGAGAVDLPIPLGALPGAMLACQWGVFTPGWNAFGWITSADIDLRWRQ